MNDDVDENAMSILVNEDETIAKKIFENNAKFRSNGSFQYP